MIGAPDAPAGCNPGAHPRSLPVYVLEGRPIAIHRSFEPAGRTLQAAQMRHLRGRLLHRIHTRFYIPALPEYFRRLSEGFCIFGNHSIRPPGVCRVRRPSGTPCKAASFDMRRPVSVLFVHHGGSVIRGSERCLLDLLRHIDRERFRPFVWCNTESVAREVGRLGVGAHVDDFPVMFHYREPRFAPARFVALLRKGRDLLREHEVRVVHANGGAPAQWMVPLARARSIPLVAHLHSPYDFADRALLGLHQASVIVGVSRAVVDPFVEEGVPPARVRVIYNGIDSARLESAGASRRRAERGIAPDAVVVAFVGSLIPRKGVDVALAAFAHVATASGVPDIHFLIVGEGPERARLTALADDLGLSGRVHFVGESTDVGAIYRDDADIGILPSRAEAFGLTLAEMGHFGLPVIGSAVGGIPEVIAHGQTGLLVPPDDVDALAKAIHKLAMSPELRAAKGSAGRSRSRSDFSIGRNVEEFEALYASLLDRPRHEFGWVGGSVSPAVYARGAWQVVERRWRSRRLPGRADLVGGFPPA